MNHTFRGSLNQHDEVHPLWTTFLVSYIHGELHLSWATSFVNYIHCELHHTWTTSCVNYNICELLEQFGEQFHTRTTWTIWWISSYVDYLILFHELHSVLNYLLKLHGLCSIWTPLLKFMNCVLLELHTQSSRTIFHLNYLIEVCESYFDWTIWLNFVS